MSKNTILRCLSYIIIFFSITAFPWWVTLIFSVIAIIYFSNYYEAVLFAFIMDAIYAAPVVKFHGIVLISFGVMLVLVFVMEKLKRRILLPMYQ